MLVTMQPATTMLLLQERILIYGLGDDGYGCVFIKDDFRMYENSAGKEKFKQSIAKVDLIAKQDPASWRILMWTAMRGVCLTLMVTNLLKVLKSIH